MNESALRRSIMRRVYYAYALRMVSMPGVREGALMFAALVVLTHFVSLGNVLYNLMHVEVGNVGSFIYGSLIQTEVWTLLCLGVFIMSALSFRFQIKVGKRTAERTFANAS